MYFSFWTFFSRIRIWISKSDLDFRPIRIRTQYKKSDPDPEEKKDPKHCLLLPGWIRKRIQIGSSSAIYGTTTGLNQAHAGDVISGHYISRQVMALTDPTVRGGRGHIRYDQQFSFLILMLKNFKQIFCFLG